MTRFPNIEFNWWEDITLLFKKSKSWEAFISVIQKRYMSPLEFLRH